MNLVTGKRLSERFRLAVLHALYRRTGDWYHVLRRFPGALFDGTGYLLFDSEAAYLDFLIDRHNLGVKQTVETNTLSIKKGIRFHPSYVLTQPNTRLT